MTPFILWAINVECYNFVSFVVAFGVILAIGLVALIDITEIWSIETFLFSKKDMDTRSGEIENVNGSVGKLSVIFSLLSSSHILFSFFYHIGYFKNYGQTNAKTASVTGSMLPSALSRLEVFHHAFLSFSRHVFMSFVSQQNEGSFNWLNFFTFRNQVLFGSGTLRRNKFISFVRTGPGFVIKSGV